MILSDSPLKLEVSSDIQKQNYKIRANRKAFEILHGQLYADRISSIIRELSTNAADSHVAANNKDTFIVHLPNRLEPWFSVRDNGIGMSEETIQELYPTYFDSDKTQSNDFTGCLGLGSKSPFAYTDQFTVESRYNGKKYTYTSYKDEDGIPAISKIGETETNERNGVEINFAVKAIDFEEFRRKAVSVLSWFVIQPKVVGVNNFVFTKPNYSVKTVNYGLANSRTYISNVVMGNVAYKIRAADLRTQETYAGDDEDEDVQKHELSEDESDVILNNKLSDLELQVLDWGIDLFVPIGSIEFTPSRENISYTKRTLKVIREQLSKAVHDIRVEIDKQISGAKTLWEARKMLFKQNHHIFGSIRNFSDITWQGKPLSASVNVSLHNQLYPANKFSLMSLTMKRDKVRKIDVGKIDADDTPIILNDIPRTGYVRASNYFLENRYSTDTVYYLNPVLPEGETIETVQDRVNKWLEETGLSEVVIRTSTLPQPPRKCGRIARKHQIAKVNEFDGTNRSNSCADYWKAAEIDLMDGGVYVEINYYRPKINNNFSHPNQLVYLVNILKNLGVNIKIYGIRPADLKVLKKYNNWQTFDEFVNNYLNKNKHYFDEAKKSKAFENLRISTWYAELGEKLLHDNPLFVKFHNEYELCKKMHEDNNLENYMSLHSAMRGYQDIVSDTTLDSIGDEINKRYPLLMHVNSYGKNSLRAVKEYVNLVDKCGNVV